MDHTEEQSDIDEVLERAGELGDGGAWSEAEELVTSTLHRVGEEPSLLCWLGAAAYERGASGVAHAYFRRCLATSPTDPTILALAGRGLALSDDPEAESTLRLAALSGPSVKLARLAYGAYLAREGLLEDALRELQVARDLDPEDPEARSELAAAYLRAGRSDDAVSEWSDRVAIQPEDPDPRTMLALLLWERGETEHAAEELHRASLEGQDDVELQLLCAVTCAAEGWDDEAWSALARAEDAAGATESGLIGAVEDAVEAGPEAAAEFMRDELAPSALRERLARDRI